MKIIDEMYNDEELQRLQKLKDAPAVATMATHYLDERKRWKSRMGFLKNWTYGMFYGADQEKFVEVDVAEAEQRVAGTFALGDVANGRKVAMSSADFAITLMVASPTVPNDLKFWVIVDKTPYGGTSRHAFSTLPDALNFMENLIEGE